MARRKVIGWLAVDMVLVGFLLAVPARENEVVVRENILVPSQQVWELMANLDVVPQADGRLLAARILTTSHQGAGVMRYYRMGGRDRFELVTDWQTNKKLSFLVVHSPGGVTERATFRLRPFAEGTNVELAVSYRPAWGLAGGAVDRLWPQNKHARRARQTLANLKLFLETRELKKGRAERHTPQAA